MWVLEPLWMPKSVEQQPQENEKATEEAANPKGYWLFSYIGYKNSNCDKTVETTLDSDNDTTLQQSVVY
eukprot:CAMPEP_0174257980 /NCGR_PEP_ID=MMETSP0439-20130205/7064_1 /TAXON_ID=0 /ORGANISM="Stereomyxa ramosa, Strain Chinc5" /LENGTH=68 /DNA_ID=CAMNT_0015341311 /DNA_START=641 /DNA_END=847 /DNA_ORIENTATION=+